MQAQFEPLSQCVTFRLVVLMVASHDQLMPQYSEWFFRRPPIIGEVSEASIPILSDRCPQQQ
jgi:hypothetical protein